MEKCSKITLEIIDKGKSNEGGWNRAQLQVVGVEWPPTKGWKDRLNGTEFTHAELDQFLALKGDAGKLKK